jgi:hypothetical protein
MPRRKPGMTWTDAVSALLSRIDTSFLEIIDRRGSTVVHGPQYLSHYQADVLRTRDEAKAACRRPPPVRLDFGVVASGTSCEAITLRGMPVLSARPSARPEVPFDVDDDGTVVIPPRPPKPSQTDEEWVRGIIR